MALAYMEWAACLGRSVQSVMAGARPGNKRKLDSPSEPCGPRHPALLPARARATSWSPVAGAPLQREMALGGLTPRGWHLEKALGMSAIPAPWHRALGLGEPAGTPGRGISAST